MVASAIACPNAIVPLAKFGISNTPNGPFQRIVFDCAITSANLACVAGPASNPIHPSGIWVTSTTFVVASFANASAMTESTGKWMVTFLASACFIISFANSSLSSSTNEFPMLPPCALMNVNVIPPPTIKWSILSKMLSIIVIFEDTFAPPSTAVTGFSPVSITLAILSISVANNNPKHFLSVKFCAITAVDACALCAVPKASFT